jgi:RHS repeat-associated protein
MTYAGGTANLAYDNDGLLTSIGRFTISRDVQTGQPVAVTSAGLNMDFAFNSYGQLKDQSISVNGSPGYAWNLNHDNAGRIQSRTDTIQGSLKTTEYTYDEIGRLSAVMENGTETERYTYYPNGARATEINVHKGITVPRTYQYTREDQLTNAGNISYTYDADGFVNTKSVGGNTTVYTYSSLGELTEVALPDGNEINYVYDPLGRRIARKYNGAVTHKYLWQGQTRLLAVYDGSDNLLMRFEYASGRMPVAMTRAGVTYYLAYDQVGSLRLVTDSAGNTIKRIDYDSFGAIFNETNSGFSVPFGFAGGLYDKNTGLVRFGFRDYDPETGRWTAKDPIRFAGGDADLYGYVLNNPVNFVDSIGLITIPPWLKTALDLSGPNSPDLNVLRRWHKELLDQREGNWKAENIILDEIDNIYDMRSSLGSYNPCLDDLYFREERMKSLLENLILNTSDLNDRIQKSQRDIENFIEMTIKSGGKIIY